MRMRMMRVCRVLLLLLGVTIVSSSPTFAATMSEAIFAYSGAGLGTQQLILTTTGNPATLNPTSMGWWDETGNHTATNTNYIAGVCSSTDACSGDDKNHHDFFVFNLANIGSTITSAQLSLFNPSNGYISDTSSLCQGRGLRTGVPLTSAGS
jgi:ABC-type transport system substrate-binding protein